jgi:hypothetical protein
MSTYWRVFQKILHRLVTDLHERGGLDLSECYIDGGTFIVVKKGGTKLERPSGWGKGTMKLMAISDSTDGLPTSIYVTSTASPHQEVITIAEATVVFNKCFLTSANEKP